MSVNYPQPPSISAVGRGNMDTDINETMPDAKAEDKESPTV